MERNTLGIREMKIVNTDIFFKQFIGMPVTLWIGRYPIYYSIPDVESIEFVEGMENARSTSIVFFGHSDDSKMAIDINYGFGIKIHGHNEQFWVDKLNAKESAIIVYDTNRGE